MRIYLPKLFCIRFFCFKIVMFGKFFLRIICGKQEKKFFYKLSCRLEYDISWMCLIAWKQPRKSVSSSLPTLDYSLKYGKFVSIMKFEPACFTKTCKKFSYHPHYRYILVKYIPEKKCINSALCKFSIIQKNASLCNVPTCLRRFYRTFF